MSIFSLNGNWSLSGNNISIPVEIPGDFHSALLAANIIEDPFVGFNEQKALWVGQTDWTISKTFQFKKINNKTSYIQLTQADTFFTLFINGNEVGKGQNAFTRYRFDITNFLVDGINEIKILFESAEKKSEEINQTLPYPVPYMKYDVYSPNRNLVRKCQCNGGWDWGPCIMVSGIYEDIFIEQVENGLFDSVMVNYEKIKNNRWKATVITTFDSIVDADKIFVFSISGNDITTSKIEKNICLHKGKNQFKAEIFVDNPSIWLTASELREQNLSENTIYDLKVYVLEDNYENSICKKICFNTLKAVSKIDYIDDKQGRSIYFENNGRKIFAKGSNWIPVDSLPSRFTEDRYYDLIKSAFDANQNCLRVWGGGYYEKEIFYDICDRLGIIIWQDCMFACSMYPTTQEFISEVRKELDYQIPRLQTHACIGIWCGNNENYGAINWFAECHQNRDRYLIDYDRLYNGVIGEKIKELDPERLYWPSSPCSGPDDYADNWHFDNRGDMHYWSVWHEKKDKEAYYSIKPRFVSEFGYESFPSLNCIKSFAEEKDWNFTSRLMEYHQRSPSGNSIILENFSRYFKFPTNFTNMVYLSQVQQAIAIKTAVDWWRTLSPYCLGALVWQLNDIWPGASWSSLEYSGKWKLLQYEEKKFFSDVYMPLFIKDKKLHCVIINDKNETLSYKININFYDFIECKEIKKSMIFEGTIAADKTQILVEQEIPEDNLQNYFIYGTLTASNSKNEDFICENTVFPTLYKHAEIQNCNINTNILKIENGFEIELQTDKPAFFVSLDTLNTEGRFNDNMLTLLPGKTKKVQFNISDKKINSSAITVEEFKKDLLVNHLYKSSK